MPKLLRKALRNPWILNILVLLAAAVLLWPFFQDVYNALDLRPGGGEAGTHGVLIEDRAELFSPEERAQLEAEMGRTARFCSVALLTTRNTEGKSTTAYMDAAMRRLYPTGAGVIFLIDLDNRTLRLQEARDSKMITVSDGESITDNVYRYASDGNYFECARSAFSQVTTVIGGEEIPRPMKHLSNLLIALCLGLMAAFWAASRQNEVNRPDEVYQINRKAYRSISFIDGNLRKIDSADYAGTLGEVLFALLKGLAEASGSDSGSSGSSGRSSSGSSGRSSSGSSGSRNSGGGAGGSHRF